MMIKVEKISKKFQKNLCLDNVSVEFKKGDKVAIMGANGAGKTTLIRAIMGYYHVDSGVVFVNGCNPSLNRVEVLEDISFIPQLPPPIKISLHELVNYTIKSTKALKEDIYQYAKRMDFDLALHGDKSFFKLSGGMKQKLLIAIAMARKSKIMVFDEPTANLDPKGREIFYGMLKEVSEDVIMLFITHRIDEIGNLINRKIYMDLGKVVEDEKF